MNKGQILRTAGGLCLTALDLWIDFLILAGEDRKIKPTKRVAAIDRHMGRLFREQDGRCRYCGVSKRNPQPPDRTHEARRQGREQQL